MIFFRVIYMDESPTIEARVIEKAREFRKIVLLNRVANNVKMNHHPENKEDIDIQYSSIELKNNFPPLLKIVKYYPTHTLSDSCQQIMNLVRISLNMVTLLMIINFSVQFYYTINEYITPFVLGFIFLLLIVPIYFKFVFYKTYKDIQAGKTHNYYILASIVMVLSTLFLILPPNCGFCSILEITNMFIKGYNAVGCIGLIIPLLTLLVMIILGYSLCLIKTNEKYLFQIDNIQL